MAKDILFVEDGSVDPNELKEVLSNQVSIITYRRGSHPPIIISREEKVKEPSEVFVVTISKCELVVEQYVTSTLPQALQNLINKGYVSKTKGTIIGPLYGMTFPEIYGNLVDDNWIENFVNISLDSANKIILQDMQDLKITKVPFYEE